MKIKGLRGIRCQYGLNQRGMFPVYFASVLFLGKMGRGYARLPFEDNRGCPWTGRISPKPFLGADFWGFGFGSARKMGIPVSQK